MKKYTLRALTLLILISAASFGQVTSAELKKYIITMDSIETLKNQLTVSMNNLYKRQP